MRVEPRRKRDCNTLLQFSTLVHVQTRNDELTDTSIQVLSSTNIFGFIYWRSILGCYGQLCHEEWIEKITVAPYKEEWTVKITIDPYYAGMVSRATNNEAEKITVSPYKAGRVNHATKSEGKDYGRSI